jgi:hypothetical protein
MNIHINKNTRFQPWNGQTIFKEYPLHIRPGNFTVTLLFHDAESMIQMHDILAEMIQEIDAEEWLPKVTTRITKALT